MPLVPCPECNHQVSTAASACPECGYPLGDHVAAADEKPSQTTVKAEGGQLAEGALADRPFAFRCGRAFNSICSGRWHDAMELLQVKAWLGRYVGFVLGLTGAVVAVPAIVGVSLPVSSVWKVFLFVSVAAIVLMPLSIAFGYWLLKRIGFALRARHFASGVGEGLVLAVVFAAIFAVSQYIQNAGNTDPLVSSSTIAPDRSSTSPGPGTRVEPLKPIQEILAQAEKDEIPSPTVRTGVASNTTEAMWEQVDSAFARGDSATVTHLLERLRNDYPGTPAGDCARRYLEAISLMREGRFDDARAQFSAASRLRPTSPVPVFALGLLASNLGGYDEAISTYSKILRSHPECATVWAYRGGLLIEQKKFEEAVDDLTKAIDLYSEAGHSPGVAASYRQRANAYGFLGKHEQVIVDLTEAIELAETLDQEEFLADCHYLRAGAYNWLGKEANVASDLARVEEIRKRLQERQAGPATENR